MKKILDTKFTFHGQNCGNTPEAMMDLIEVLCRLRFEGMVAFPGAGTALGLCRDGKLLDHDTDIDVEVFCTPRNKELCQQVVDSSMKQMGARKIIEDSHQLVYVKHNDLPIDIGFYVLNKQEEKFVMEHEAATLSVSKENVGKWPAYLAERYGTDWQTPKGGTNDKWWNGDGVQRK